MSSATAYDSSSSVDVNLHSRVICALGLSAVERIIKTEVLFIGFPGAAAEAAKNLSLSGIKRIILCDPSPLTWDDCSENAFIDFATLSSVKDVNGSSVPSVNGSTSPPSRAMASVSALKALNPTTVVEAWEPTISDSDVATTADHQHGAFASCLVRIIKAQLCSDTGVAVIMNPEQVLPLLFSYLFPTTSTAHIAPESLLFALTDSLRGASVPCVVCSCYGTQMSLVADFGKRDFPADELPYTFTIEDPTGDRGERGLVLDCAEDITTQSFVIKIMPPEVDTIANFSTDFDLVWEGLLHGGSVAAHIPIVSSKATQPKTPDEKLYVTLVVDATNASFLPPRGRTMPENFTTTSGTTALIEALKDLSSRFGSISSSSSSPPTYLSTTVKPVTESHLSIREAFEGSIEDAKSGCSMCPHSAIGFAALRKLGRVPNRYSSVEVQAYLQACQAIQPDADGDAIRTYLWFLATCQGGLATYAAVAGGYASQEVMKFASRQYRPTNRHVYYGDSGFVAAIPVGCKVDALLQESLTATIAEEMSPKVASSDTRLNFVGKKFLNTRYQGAAELLGGDRLDFIQNSNIFVVGAGALGCEYLKNLAMLGAGVGPKGGVTVTDNDHIERSNLTRQFLFRDHHVGASKAQTAASVVKALINNKCKIRALTEKVCEETCRPTITGLRDPAFDKRFWQRVSVVAIAVDNNKARAFLLEQCRRLSKPIINAGTLGPQGSIDAVIPFVTAIPNIADEGGGGGSKIPQCTLHFFPSTINHCIQFAVDAFAAIFKNPIQTAEQFTKSMDSVNNCCSKPKSFQDHLSTWEANNLVDVTVSSLHELLIANPIFNFEACVAAAVRLFTKWHVTNVKRLLEQHPLDAVDHKSGAKFWSGAKVPPKATPLCIDALKKFTEEGVDFTSNSSPSFCNQVDFLVSASMLFAEVFGIKVPSCATSEPHAKLQQAVLSVAVEMLPVVLDEVEGQERQRREQIAKNTLPEKMESAVDDSEEELRQRELLAKEADERYKAKLAVMITDLSNLFHHSEVEKVQYLATHFHPQEFEKDVDENFHVSFVTACSNARAMCYGIPTESFLQTKRIAGNILPALVTTTAVVTGLATIQLLQAIALPSIFIGKATRTASAPSIYDTKSTNTSDALSSILNSASQGSTTPATSIRATRAHALAQLYACGGISVANAHNSSLFECDPEIMRPVLKLRINSEAFPSLSEYPLTVSASRWDIARVTLADDCSLSFFAIDCLKLWLTKEVKKVVNDWGSTSADGKQPAVDEQTLRQISMALEAAIGNSVWPKSISDCATGAFTIIPNMATAASATSTSAITLAASIGVRTRLGLADLYRDKHADSEVSADIEDNAQLSVEPCDFYYLIDAALFEDMVFKTQNTSGLQVSLEVSGPLPLFHLNVSSRGT